MSESHRSALLRRDLFQERSTEAADRFEREYVQSIAEGASPIYAEHIAKLFTVEKVLPESAANTFRQQRRKWRKDAGLPPRRDADDVTDADKLPSIEDLSAAT